MIAWTVPILLLLSAALPTSRSDAPSSLHPQDGPDVDVQLVIDSEKVRLQMTPNLCFIDAVIGMRRENPDILHPAEYDALKRAMEIFFKAKNKVVIDGVRVDPVTRSFAVEQPDKKLVPMFPRFGMRAMTKIRLVVDYPIKQKPRRVAFEWGSYPPDVALATEEHVPLLEVKPQVIAFGEDKKIVLTHDEPEYIWHHSPKDESEVFMPVPAPAPDPTMQLPMLSIGIVLGFLGGLAFVMRKRGFGAAFRGGAVMGGLAAVVAVLLSGVGRVEIANPFGPKHTLPSEADAKKAFAALHSNIYRAFDFTADSEVYDALARSVHGKLLDSLYNQVYQGLVLQEEGGAVCRVKNVDRLETKVEEIGVLPPDGEVIAKGEDTIGFRVRSKWRVFGEVFHFGHGHTRTNEYEARYTVARAGADWRIVGQQVLGEKRVDAEPIPDAARDGQTGGQQGDGK